MKKKINESWKEYCKLAASLKPYTKCYSAEETRGFLDAILATAPVKKASKDAIHKRFMRLMCILGIPFPSINIKTRKDERWDERKEFFTYGFKDGIRFARRAQSNTVRPKRAVQQPKAKISAALRSIPTSWLDPLLTGKQAVVGSPPYSCTDVEKILLAVKKRVETALTSAIR